MMNYTAFDAAAHLRASLPHRPFAGNAKDAFERQSQEDALKRRYLAIDPPALVIALKFDLDEPKGRKLGRQMAVNFIDADLPQPHFMMQRPNNEGCQYVYLLHSPVGRSMASRMGPRKLMQAVIVGFTQALGADRGYTGYGIKNPFHRAWQTYVNNAPPFELTDLLHCLPESLRRTPERANLVSDGRNTDLFDCTRLWAYGQIKHAHREGNLTRWADAVSDYAHSQNQYSPALGRREVESIARSVSTWTWRNADSLSGRPPSDIKRGDMYSWNRPTLTAEQAKQNMREGGRIGGLLGGSAGGLIGGVLGAPITHAIRRNSTFDSISGAIGLLASQGVHNPSHNQIAITAQRSVSTVERFMRASRLGASSN